MQSYVCPCGCHNFNTTLISQLILEPRTSHDSLISHRHSVLRMLPLYFNPCQNFPQGHSKQQNNRKMLFWNELFCVFQGIKLGMPSSTMFPLPMTLMLFPQSHPIHALILPCLLGVNALHYSTRSWNLEGLQLMHCAHLLSHV